MQCRAFVLFVCNRSEKTKPIYRFHWPFTGKKQLPATNAWLPPIQN